MSEERTHFIHHHRFGELEIPQSVVLHIDGLPGFEKVERLAILQHDQSSPFAWLISLDDPDLALAVTDPRRFFVDYAPEPTPQQRRAIGLEDGEDCDLMAIATLTRGTATLNLAAPILVNPSTRRATQAILEDDRHPLRAALPLDRAPSQAPTAAAPDQIESNPQR